MATPNAPTKKFTNLFQKVKHERKLCAESSGLTTMVFCVVCNTARIWEVFEDPNDENDPTEGVCLACADETAPRTTYKIWIRERALKAKRRARAQVEAEVAAKKMKKEE